MYNNNGKIECKIEEVYGVLDENEKEQTLFARVSWNGKPAKDEVRRWKKDSDGNRGNAIKGNSLSRVALKNLRYILDDMEL